MIDCDFRRNDAILHVITAIIMIPPPCFHTKNILLRSFDIKMARNVLKIPLNPLFLRQHSEYMESVAFPLE